MTNDGRCCLYKADGPACFVRCKLLPRRFPCSWRKARSQRFSLGAEGQQNPGAKAKRQQCINKATPVKAMRAAEEKR